VEGYKDTNKPIEERVTDLLSRMTLEEKVAQLQSVWGYDVMDNRSTFNPDKAAKRLADGIGQITRHGNATQLMPREVAAFADKVQRFLVENTRLGIPAIMHEECLCGYQARTATIFPQAIGQAATWDPEIIRRMTEAIRAQLRAVGAHQGLAPVLDIAREPRWGRCEETYGEDPYLAAACGKAYIEGLQGGDPTRGIMATTKHFAGYSFCEGGLNWAPAHLGEREFREVCLLPFEVAVREAGVMSVMNAYHEIDGVPCAANKRLLTATLRDEWGFEGIVVSDYESIFELFNYHKICPTRTEAAALALEAGIDVELPEIKCYDGELVEAVRSGRLPQKIIDRAVARVLRAKFLLGLFENPYVDVDKTPYELDSPEHRRLSLEIARKSITLLKNEGNLLPLSRNVGRIAVIGPNADSRRNLLGDYTYPAILELRKIVHETMAPELTLEADTDIEALTVPVVSVLEGIKAKVPPACRVTYAEGCGVLGDSKEGFAEAVRLAAEADAAVLVVGGKSGYTPGCTSGEERDRADLNLPGIQEELVRAVHAAGTPLVVVLVHGRAYSIGWIARNAAAIVDAWLPGEEGGTAVADVLFGDYNPGGRLPVTFPLSVGQIPVYYAHKPSARKSHLWGNYVDSGTDCLFPFGHGLSYTTFAYSNPSIEPQQVPADGAFRVSFDLKNTGDREGEEAAQLYLRDTVSSVTRPVKELKGFRRVRLSPGENKRIVFELSTDLLAFYDADMRLVVEPGEFQIMIGASSADIRLSAVLEVTGSTRIIAGPREYFST
jgi:beta-glucosidase